MLSACSTIYAPPPVVTKSCHPPQDYMLKYSDLKSLPKGSLSEKQILDQWIVDTKSYNNLNVDHNGLIDWVNTFCK